MISVKFFASLREDVGHDHLALAVSSLAELRDALADQLSSNAQKALWADGVRLAINQQLVPFDWRTDSEDLARVQKLLFCPR